MEIDRRKLFAFLGGPAAVAAMSHEAKADALEHYMAFQLNAAIAKKFPTAAEVAEKITQVNQGASATGSASAQVLASARSLSRESGNLKNEVDNFLNTVRAA